MDDSYKNITEKIKRPLKLLKRMYEFILRGYLDRCRQDYLLFHGFYIQNGPLGLFSLKFSIAEVINVTRHFLDLGYSLVTSPQRKTKKVIMKIFFCCFKEIDNAIQVLPHQLHHCCR